MTRPIGWLDRRVLVVAGLATAALTVVHLDLAFGFVTSGLLGLGLVTIVAIALLLAVAGLLRRSRAALVIGSYAILGVGLSACLGSVIVRLQTHRSFERGDAIASALAGFRSARGAFPDSLDALAPKHLETVPLTSMGLLRRVPFRYAAEPGRDGYQLGFAAPGWVVCHRTEEENGWECDD